MDESTPPPLLHHWGQQKAHFTGLREGLSPHSKPEAWSNVVESAQAATRQIDVAGIAALSTDGKKDVSVTNCVPGFYYTIYGGAAVTNLKSFVSEKSRNVLCEPGKPVKFSEVVKPSDAAGFFSIGVKETGDVSASAE